MFQRMGESLRRFMTGRYGADKLSQWTMILAVIISFVSLLVSPVLTLVSYVLMGWTLFRMFSRNTYKRYRENQRFLQWLDRIKDRNNRHFSCPKCHQQVRVPKGKGKIAIKCPRCQERFIKKT